MLSFLNNLSVRGKALTALAALLICMLQLGATAILTVHRSTEGVRSLAAMSLPKQNAVEELKEAITGVYVNMFRYATLAGNGASPAALRSLREELITKADEVAGGLTLFSRRLDLDETERRIAEGLPERWTRYAGALKDVTEIARLQPNETLVLLDGADDDFKKVETELSKISAAVVGGTITLTRGLAADADRSAKLLLLGGFLSVIASLAIAILVARSIVEPIRSVTEAMTAISAGNNDVELRIAPRRDEIGAMVDAITVFREKMERDNRLLNERESELRTQNRRFDAALSNMSQGLAMFDKDRKLIVSNPRYAEVYGLPSELVRAGTSQNEILQFRVSAGAYPGDPDKYVEDRLLNASVGKASDRVMEMKDGRVIAVSHRPMEGGGWVSTHDDISERRRAEAKIEHMARHDALTNLANRTLFRERLEEALVRVRRGDSLAVLCLDLDRFKSVNDTLGHPVGDALLRCVAERLQDCVRETDSIARLGGDEFAVIQVATERPHNVAPLARRIVDALSAPYDVEGHHIVIGASVGIALSPNDGTDPDALLKAADLALYRAKADGRGTFRYFEADMDAQMQSRRALEVGLRKALANGEFELYYQPLVNLERDEVTGFEALLRWNSPERGIVSPAEFIPVAEEIGLIVPLGEWVLRRACEQAVLWPGGIKVAVNLSPVQFQSRNLVPAVISALATSGLPGTRLELEITETVLLQDADSTLEILHQLKALGVRISMDDFGTGYSSLSYLRSFPFDKIKIDRSFVKDLDHRGDCAAIVRAVAILGSSLGMSTTAEGVESREQLDRVKEQGCTEVQGYWFSPPRPAHELEFLIRRESAAA